MSLRVSCLPKKSDLSPGSAFASPVAVLRPDSEEPVVVAFDVGLRSGSAHSTSFVPYRSLSARKSLIETYSRVKGKGNL